MRRREFIAGLGSTAAWQIAARAQNAIPVIGFLGAGFPAEWNLEPFRQGLAQAGFLEGQNVGIEYRWAENRYDRLPALAAELVRRQPAVIAVFSSTPAAIAAKTATTTIPIVFTVGADPVEFRLVASLNRPGGNATGVSFLTSLLAAKQFELLHQLLPAAQAVAVLVNPTNPYAEAEARDVRQAASELGREVDILNVSTDQEIDAAFISIAQKGIRALHIPGDAFLYTRREQVVELAARHAILAIYAQREFADAGGLMSYGSDLDDASRLAAGYVARILKGEAPAELPVQLSTKVELVLNMKAAKALGVVFPLNLLGRADEVIE
jgi:putative tryptophan/tyrosine transport system substrate-binding protein